jgi:tight adherence protein B
VRYQVFPWLLATLAIVVSTTSPAWADDAINIDNLDSERGRVQILLALDRLGVAEPDLDSITVSWDGVDVPVSSNLVTDEASGDVARTVILALDTSNSMRSKITSAKAAATAFINSAPEEVKIGLVTFAGEVTTLTPTTDHASVLAAIAGVQLQAGTQLYDAIGTSVSQLGDSGARSVLLLSDGKDTNSQLDVGAAERQLAKSGAVLDVVSLDQELEHLTLLRGLTRVSGGEVISTEPEALAEVFTDQAVALEQAAIVSFTKPPGSPSEATLEIRIDATSGQATDSAFYRINGEAPLQLESRSVQGDGLPAWSLYLSAFAVCLGLVGIAGFALFGARRNPLQEQLAQYSVSGGQPVQPEPAESAPTSTPLLESAVELTKKVVTGDFETRLALKLAGAGLAMTAAEWLLFQAAVAVGAAILGLVLGGPALAFLFFVLGLVLPLAYMQFRHSRRQSAFNSQLAETLTLISGGLSAGLSLPQAADTVVREGAEPMAGEMRRALVEQRLGLEISDALDGIAQRMKSEDFSWVVMAIRIQREVGGNLSELLNTVADTLRERDYVRRQVKVLSAEGRISAWVLSVLPFLIFFYLLLVRPDFVRPLYTTLPGFLMLGAAAGLLGMGIFVLSRLVKIEV